MNNTKWKEILAAFYDLENNTDIETQWMTKDLNGFVYGWDQTWTHFCSETQNYKSIEWLKIKLDKLNRDTVIQILKNIHVPGEVSETEVTVYGYRVDVDYI